MAKFTIMETSKSIQPLLDLGRIMARQPTQELIFSNSLGFKNSSYCSLKKQREIGARIIRETYFLDHLSGKAMRCGIMATLRPNGARKSNESFIFTRETFHRAYRTYSSLLAYVPSLAIQCLNFPSNITSYAVVIVAIAIAARLKLLQIPKNWKRLINVLTKLHKRTSADPNPNRTLIDKDLLFSVDVYKIENFAITIGLLLAWWVLNRLIIFVRRFYSEKLQ